MAGSWSNSYQASLTLPTGATIGARIVLDGASGLILVYDDTNQLIASIAPADTTDAAGTDVLQGITNYAGSEYVQLGFGNLLLGVTPDPLDPSFQPEPGLVGIVGDSSSIFIQSATNQDLPDISYIQPTGGDDSVGTGHSTFPHHETSGDIWIGEDSSLIWTYTPPGQGQAIPETWHNLTLGTGWATGPGIAGSYPPLKYRQTGQNEAHLFGTFHATSTTPATILVAGGLPAVSMTNLGGVAVIGTAERMSATAAQIPLYSNNTGDLRSAALPAIAVNDTFMINRTYPLGNLP